MQHSLVSRPDASHPRFSLQELKAVAGGQPAMAATLARAVSPPVAAMAAMAAIAALAAGSAQAQPSTGTVWETFGPSGSSGVFTEITGVHNGAISAYAVAADPGHRIVTLNQWKDAQFDLDLDCAVTRHLPDARMLDMDFTGELEASRRIALNLGGELADRCRALDIDSASRPVIAGYASTDGPDTAFVVRLSAADGSYDESFSSNGRFTLENLVGFFGLETRFSDVEIDSQDRVVTCGYVERAGERNMLVMRFLTNGALDASFHGNGWREIDWNGGGGDDDTCERLVILPDERIVLAGVAQAPGSGAAGYALARLHDNGDLDFSFHFDGKALIDDGSVFTSPTVVDVGYDAARQRLVVAATAIGLNMTPGGALVAVGNGGFLDPAFNGNGRRSLRFSDFGGDAPAREPGATWLRRLLMRPDGSFYLAGTHENSPIDASFYGPTDLAVVRLLPDGSDDTTPGRAFSGDGVAFFAYIGIGHQNVASSVRARVGDTLEDAIFYRGNVLLLSETNRYPEGTWGGENYDLGPIAPVVGGIVTERIWNEDWEPDALAEPTSLFATIPVPAGYGRYCSARDSVSGGFSLLAQGATSDPCQELLDSDPNLIIERAGLYALAGLNNVLAACDGDYVSRHFGTGGAPFAAAVSATVGQSDCIFTAAPHFLPVFSRPYSGEHVAESAQSFNHDVYNIPIDVSDFGQVPVADHPEAHYIDLNGIQTCDSSPQHEVAGVNEAAADIGYIDGRDVVAVAAGRVAAAVPRYVLELAAVGFDPFQREVFVRHAIGFGRYTEQFTTYYAHMSDTPVRRGDAVVAGTVLGRVGTTGASSGNHLHIAVFRHRNLSYRASFELDYSSGDLFDGDNEAAAIDPWGWNGPPAADPWAWRFRSSDTHPDNAGSWSIHLWKPNEAPTMYLDPD
jgi:uncharacterized delta-60 repeat protein